jgi:Ca2+-binding EF-hand superfamily protein
MSKSVSSNSSVNSYSKDFSATELAEIKEAFAMFDIDGGGT